MCRFPCFSISNELCSVSCSQYDDLHIMRIGKQEGPLNYRHQTIAGVLPLCARSFCGSPLVYLQHFNVDISILRTKNVQQCQLSCFGLTKHVSPVQCITMPIICHRVISWDILGPVEMKTTNSSHFNYQGLSLKEF